MTSPFDHPEAQKVFETLFSSLPRESDKGAILVGAAHVDNCYLDLFAAAFPASLSKSKRTDLTKWPGVLSSFSAKIELAYALRLTPLSAYTASSVLRKIRNDVAHTSDAFDLRSQIKRVQAIYEALGETLPAGLRRMSLEMILEYKSSVIIDFMNEYREKEGESAFDIKNKQQAVEYISQNPELMAAMDQEVPRWELAIGLSLLCSTLIRCRDDVKTVFGDSGTVSQLARSFREKSERDMGATLGQVSEGHSVREPTQPGNRMFRDIKAGENAPPLPEGQREN